MSEIEKLVESYEKYITLPWDTNLAGPQKVWFAEYDPSQERRLRLRIEAFQTATTMSQPQMAPGRHHQLIRRMDGKP